MVVKINRQWRHEKSARLGLPNDEIALPGLNHFRETFVEDRPHFLLGNAQLAFGRASAAHLVIGIAFAVDDRHPSLAASVDQGSDMGQCPPSLLAAARLKFVNGCQGILRRGAGKGSYHIDNEEGGVLAECLFLAVLSFVVNFPVDLGDNLFPFAHKRPRSAGLNAK